MYKTTVAPKNCLVLTTTNGDTYRFHLADKPQIKREYHWHYIDYGATMYKIRSNERCVLPWIAHALSTMCHGLLNPTP